jgi:hypothetical protein
MYDTELEVQTEKRKEVRSSRGGKYGDAVSQRVQERVGEAPRQGPYRRSAAEAKVERDEKEYGR